MATEVYDLSWSFRSCKDIGEQELPAYLESKIEPAVKQVRALRARFQHPLELIINKDETSMYFDMVPGQTINKKATRYVKISSSGAEI